MSNTLATGDPRYFISVFCSIKELGSITTALPPPSPRTSSCCGPQRKRSIFPLSFVVITLIFSELRGGRPPGPRRPKTHGMNRVKPLTLQSPEQESDEQSHALSQRSNARRVRSSRHNFTKENTDKCRKFHFNRKS